MKQLVRMTMTSPQAIVQSALLLVYATAIVFLVRSLIDQSH